VNGFWTPAPFGKHLGHKLRINSSGVTKGSAPYGINSRAIFDRSHPTPLPGWQVDVGRAAILPDWGQGCLVAAKSLPVSSYIFSRQEM